VGASVGVSVGVTVPTSVGVGVSVDFGVGVGAFVGAEVDEPLNVILGSWLFVSVTLNDLVVSCIVNVTVPAF